MLLSVIFGDPATSIKKALLHFPLGDRPVRWVTDLGANVWRDDEHVQIVYTEALHPFSLGTSTSEAATPFEFAYCIYKGTNPPLDWAKKWCETVPLFTGCYIATGICCMDDQQSITARRLAH
ncbi:hypothetical protein [Roseateles paludis]|jgi:hypothetical protein|uniref:Uncharacterized protein n=1 Tax=Roseateles paludis TaxID=3145238 RepID=A0ABV0G172_9BURK